MDLAIEVQRLILDVVAVDVSECLERAGIPHALLKGPSTAIWLYDQRRSYADVDVLVPLSRVPEVRKALESAGLAYATAGGVGEEAQHSLLMFSPAGCEVDLHVSLPAVPPAGDRVWEVLAPHVEALDLGIGTVPALDEPARCLMLALHALGGGRSGSPVQDLRRALAVTTRDRWYEARELARALNAEDLFLAGQAAGDADPSRAVRSRRASLYVTGVPSEALALQRLRDARRRDLPRLLWREAFPTLGFIRHAYPYTRGPISVSRMYAARWRRIGANLPAAIRAWRTAARTECPNAVSAISRRGRGRLARLVVPSQSGRPRSPPDAHKVLPPARQSEGGMRGCPRFTARQRSQSMSCAGFLAVQMLFGPHDSCSTGRALILTMTCRRTASSPCRGGSST